MKQSSFFRETTQQCSTKYIREKCQEKCRNYANRSRVFKYFKPGQLVYIRNNVIAGASGLQVRNTGPAVIEQISKNAHTAEVRDIHTHVRTKQHFAHLTPVSAIGEGLPDCWDEAVRNASQTTQ